MRIGRRHLALAALLGLVGAIATAFSVTQAAAPSIIAVDPYSWQAEGASPAAVTIMAGGEVKFSYPSGASRHFPVLHAGPTGASLSCPNVPTTEATAGPGWAGSCTFSKAGTYTIYCGVHGSLMTATVTVTSEGEPTAVTEAATSVTEHEATLEGTVNPNGHSTTYRFQYGTTAAYGNETAPSAPVAGTAAMTASAPVSGLAAGSTYHFRLVATNEKGTAEGGDETFTTPGPPTATTGSATSVTEAGATLRGTVNPGGHSTTYFFQYGSTTSYGEQTTAQPLGAGTTGVPVSVPVSGLAAGATYHYRLVAKNEKGTVEGTDATFTTLSPTLPEEPAKEPPAGGPSPTPTSTPTPAPMPGPISPSPELAPLVPPLVEGSLELAAPRHRTSVRGSLQVSRSGASGRLEVDLLANSALHSRRGPHGKQIVVGRLVRASVPAGKVSFSVGLNAHGKSALHRHRKLAVTVKITLTPPVGKAQQMTRSVILRL